MRNDARNHGNIEKWSSSSSIWRAGPGQEAREKPPLVFLSISSSSCVNKNNALGPAPVPDAGSRRSIYTVVIASGNEYRLSVKKGREKERAAVTAAVPILNLEIVSESEITKLLMEKVNSRCNKIKCKVAQVSIYLNIFHL